MNAEKSKRPLLQCIDYTGRVMGHHYTLSGWEAWRQSSIAALDAYIEQEMPFWRDQIVSWNNRGLWRKAHEVADRKSGVLKFAIKHRNYYKDLKPVWV